MSCLTKIFQFVVEVVAVTVISVFFIYWIVSR